MNLSKLRSVWLSVLAVSLVVAWAIVIWVACVVSTIVLDSLQMIVDLAAMS